MVRQEKWLRDSSGNCGVAAVMMPREWVHGRIRGDWLRVTHGFRVVVVMVSRMCNSTKDVETWVNDTIRVALAFLVKLERGHNGAKIE